jgi:hypothetical protein
VGCCISHWGKEGSVGVLDVSAGPSVRSEAEYASSARSKISPLPCLDHPGRAG